MEFINILSEIQKSIGFTEKIFFEFKNAEKANHVIIYSQDKNNLFNYLDFEKQGRISILNGKKVRKLVILKELRDKCRILIENYKTVIQKYPVVDDDKLRVKLFATEKDYISCYYENVYLGDFAWTKFLSPENIIDFLTDIEYFLSREILLENRKDDKPTEIELQPNNVENTFCKRMPLNFAKDHFKKFTRLNKSKKPFLTNDQVDLFIRKAFLNENGIDLLSFNYGPREAGLIKNWFYEFYNQACDKNHETTNQCRDKYIRLLTNNFTGWDFKDIKSNFAKPVKHTL